MHFDASESRSETGSISDYAWDFDGSETYSSNGGESPSISHTFSSPGTYTVDLRVKNSLGETGTVSRTITVGAALGQYEQAVEKTDRDCALLADGRVFGLVRSRTSWVARTRKSQVG